MLPFLHTLFTAPVVWCHPLLVDRQLVDVAVGSGAEVNVYMGVDVVVGGT